MIVYDLKCDKGHVFEAWFRSSAGFEEQAAAGEVSCAVCGSRKVAKALMAPRLSRGAGKDDGGAARTEAEQDAASGEVARDVGKVAVPRDNAAAAELRQKLKELRQNIESNCDYVGSAFAEEARKIHYGETEPRGIYGETSDDEAGKLKDEGISFMRVPWIRKDNA
jgi:hypothetical protein